jgi:hypothetical protein
LKKYRPDTAELTAPVIALFLKNLQREQPLLHFGEVQEQLRDLLPSEANQRIKGKGNLMLPETRKKMN